MSGTTDELKGRIKEAAGALTDNNELREEGKTDQAVGKSKQVVTAQKALDKAKELAAAEKAEASAKSCDTACD